MNSPPSFRIIQSASADARLRAAANFLRGFSSSQPVTIVAPSRGAADDLARRLAAERGATVGLARYSLTQLAARIAASRLARLGIAPASRLGSEAVAARVAFDATSADALHYFDAVAATPGFPRALAHTIGDLRAAGVGASGLNTAGPAGADLAHLLAAAERQYEEVFTADRAHLFTHATAGLADEPGLRAPLVLLDLPLDTVSESRFAAALTRHATAVFATVAAHDRVALDALTHAGGELIEQRGGDPIGNALARLRVFVFDEAAPPEGELDESVEFFSAPGEGREAVEVARRILIEARRGVPFDEIAILLRAPQQYQGLLEHALERAGVPAWFDRGTRRPHPAGRAFLALLGCAADGLSARRFAEYLSLGQLPSTGVDDSWQPPGDDLLRTPTLGAVADDEAVEEELEAGTEHSGDPRGAGTLPAPRRWERLIVEASVIGGDPARWERRLDGLEAELRRRLAELNRADAQSARAEGVARDIHRLRQLRAFAIPLVSELAEWPQAAPWGDWLARLETLAPRVLRMPASVLRVLADLRPMAAVGPVSLHEVRSVLAGRLLNVEAEPPARRYGRVFIGSPAQARGRAFRVVLVPGLAERMFPQKPRQDPLLPDHARELLDSRLSTRTAQGLRERLQLRLAIGAATERIYLSYPRLEVVEGRARVPSFYALDVVRGATGRIPDHEVLAAAAASAGDPSLAWPAPADPSIAVDEQEHDLAVLRGLLDSADPASVRGHAHYMLKLNPALKRSLTDRWARAERKWTQYDGLTRVVEGTADALAASRLGARPYSLSALQRFAACPYQFLLGAVYRLQPAEQRQPLQKLDPLTKGSLVHAIQASFFRRLAAELELPVTPASLPHALECLEQSVREVGAHYEEELAPAVQRVWRDELSAIAADLRGWVHQMAERDSGWTPRYFELAFGLPVDPDRDPHSVSEPVTIDGRFVLRGAIDLVEEERQTGVLRVTDHKTGRDRHKDAMIIGGGEVLQPVLYSLVVEHILARTVSESRLSFCTSAGGFSSRVVRLTPESRRAGIEALEVVDRALEHGTLAAAPRDNACGWCDFRVVCGPHEEERVRRKPREWLADLIALRSRA